MGYDGSLKFDTEINEKGFSSGVNNLSKLGRIASGGLKVLGGAVVGVAAAMGAGVAAGVKYNASIEQYQTSFEVMTGSADKASDVIERLKKVGAETPFELPDLADTTQLLMNYGFTADDAMDSMMMLGDISQGSADKMGRIATAYGQMSSAGKVSLEDVKQMIEAGFNPLQEISESTGESMASLYDRISKGTISVDEITASMERATSEGGKYYQSMEKQSQTVTGMISTLKDNAQQLLGEVVKPISESIASDLLPGAIGAIEQLTTAFKENGVDGLIEAGGQVLTNLLLGIAQKLPSVIDTAVQIIQSIMTNINSNLPQLLSAGGQILQSLITGVVQLLPMLGELALNLILQLANGIAENAPQIIPKGIEIILQFINGILSALPQVVTAGIQLIVSLVNGLVEAVPQLVAYLPTIISTILNVLTGALPQILEAGVQILVALLNGIIATLPELIATVPQIISGLINALINSLPQFISSGIKIIGALAAGLIRAIPSIVGAIPKIASSVISAFGNVRWGSVGVNIIKGIASGLSGAAGAIVDAAKSAARSALNAAKRFLGIHSPSKVFQDQVGKYMALGMGVGFQKNVPTESMTESVKDSVSTMNKKVGAITKVGGTAYRQTTPGRSIDPPDGDPPIILETTNIFEVDGERLAEKTTKKVVKKISKDQSSKKNFRGGITSEKIRF